MKIFVSYTLRDKETNHTVLENVYAKLSEYSEVYIDLFDKNRSQEKVIKELSNSNYVFLLLSSSIYNSEWVQKEINKANELQIPLIPCSIENLQTFDQSEIFQLLHKNASNN